MQMAESRGYVCLRATYCLLPIYCLLPTAYCLLLSSSLPSPGKQAYVRLIRGRYKSSIARISFNRVKRGRFVVKYYILVRHET